MCSTLHALVGRRHRQSGCRAAARKMSFRDSTDYPLLHPAEDVRMDVLVPSGKSSATRSAFERVASHLPSGRQYHPYPPGCPSTS